MVSLLVVLKTGNAVETATVGREGVVGAMARLGLQSGRPTGERGGADFSGTISKDDRSEPGPLQSVHRLQ